MIETVMYVMLGALLAGLLGLLLAAPLWQRAVRLTKRRLEATMPISPADIQADKDQARAAFAVETRRIEIELERTKNKAMRYLVERGKAQAEVDALKSEMQSLRTRLAERDNEQSVLEQVVRRRLPNLEAQIGEATALLAARERELSRLSTAFANQGEGVAQARATMRRQAEEIDRLRRALEGEVSALGRLSPRRGATADAETLLSENRKLTAELSRVVEERDRLREETLSDTDLLRFELRSLAERMMSLAGEEPGHADGQPADGELPRKVYIFGDDPGHLQGVVTERVFEPVLIASETRAVESGQTRGGLEARAREWMRMLTGLGASAKSREAKPDGPPDAARPAEPPRDEAAPEVAAASPPSAKSAGSLTERLARVTDAGRN